MRQATNLVNDSHHDIRQTPCQEGVVCDYLDLTGSDKLGKRKCRAIGALLLVGVIASLVVNQAECIYARSASEDKSEVRVVRFFELVGIRYCAENQCLEMVYVGSESKDSVPLFL